MGRTKITGEWFYYSHTGKWYRFTDERDKNGLLLSRVCEKSDYEPGKDPLKQSMHYHSEPGYRIK